MKILNSILLLIAGAVFGFFIAKSYTQPQQNLPTDAIDSIVVKTEDAFSICDSLDAVKVAPGSHAVVYEDSMVRILRVSLAPNSTEPIHTHGNKSVMWFTQSAPLLYYAYASQNGKLLLTDSIPIKEFPAEQLNKGSLMDPEGPHAIKNVSNKEGIAYRVEFKNQE